MAHKQDSNGGCKARSKRRLRESRSSWADAARAGHRCCSGCASAWAAARCSTSTSSAAPAHPSGSSPRSPAHRRFRRTNTARRRTAREAFDMTMAFMSHATAPGGGPATFLLDEVLELRTFESFPGSAPRAAGPVRRARHQQQPLRADLALRRPRAQAAARRHGALRGDARAAAHGRRGHRPAGAGVQRLRPAGGARSGTT